MGVKKEGKCEEMEKEARNHPGKFPKKHRGLCLFMAAILSGLSMLSLSPRNVHAENAGDAVVKSLYLDSFDECATWTKTSGGDVSTPIDTDVNVKQGKSALRLKLANGDGQGGYEWAKIIGNPVENITKEQTALQFWFNPIIARKDVQVGIVCESNGTYPTLRVSLNDFLNLKTEDYGDWKWKQVILPFSYLSEHGSCYDENEKKIGIENFSWDRVVGMTIGATTEELTDQAHWCRLDEVVFAAGEAESTADTSKEKYAEAHYEADVLPETYQQVTGWGVYPSNQEGEAFTTKTAMQKALFAELGITRFRMELRGNCVDDQGNFNENMSSLIAKLKIGVETYGVKEYTLNIWSPPSSMKTNGNYASGKNEDGSVAGLLEDKETAFCDYIIASLDHLTKENGLPAPIAISLQNEPGTATEYQSCYYGKEQYKRVAVLLRATLDKAGYQDISLMGPESDEYKNSATWLGEGFSELENDTAFADAIDIIASHSYKGKDATDQDIADYSANVKKFPDKEVWMTEFCTAGFLQGEKETDRAIEAIRILDSDMEWAGNNSWFWWLGWDPRYEVKNPYQEVLLSGDGGDSVYKGTLFQILSKIYNSVPVGSKVQRMSTNDTTVVNQSALQSDMAAFDTKDGTVCVIVNTSDTSKAYDIGGLKGKSISVYNASTEDETLRNAGSINVIENQAKEVYVPKRSVNIVVADQEDGAAPAITVADTADLLKNKDQYFSRKPNISLTGAVDEPSEVTVNGKAVQLDENGAFAVPVTLEEGANTITVQAVDAAGNEAKKTMDITYDPEYLAIVMDKTSDKVNSTAYTIKGSVNAASDVKINDKSITLATDLTFAQPVTLAQGDNKYEITATGENGIAAEPVTLSVSCDSEKPVISVENGVATTDDSEYVIRGTVSEDLEAFHIGKEEVSLNEDRSFTKKVSLKKGTNEIKLEAKDSYGNTGSAAAEITYAQTASSAHRTNAVTYARKAQSKITIDGDVTEADWKLDNKANKAFNGDPDNIFNFGTLWDADYLYVAAIVKDTRVLCGAENAYDNDCVEVFLNPSNSKGTEYSGKDQQLFIGYNKDRESLFQNTDTAVKSAWKDVDGGYSVEIAIPWTSMDLTPADGLKIGFDAANDDQDISGSRQSVVGWSGTGEDWKDTSKFGTLILSESQDITYVDFEDETPEPFDAEALLVAPESIDNKKDGTFNAQIKGNGIENGTKMLQFIMEVPDCLEVLDVVPNRNVSGGTIEWNVEKTEKGNLLRAVYSDLTAYHTLTTTETELADLFNVSLRLKTEQPQDSKLTLSLKNLDYYLSADVCRHYNVQDGVTEIGFASPDQIRVTATELYTGDGSDLIPNGMKAVKVMFSGLENRFAGSISFGQEPLYYSPEFTEKSKIATYVFTVDSSVTLEQLNTVGSYTFLDTKGQDILFGDTDKNEVIDAQDALNEVVLWLRKPTSDVTAESVLTYNVSADQRIDNADTLNIVEHFIAQKTWPILNK